MLPGDADGIEQKTFTVTLSNVIDSPQAVVSIAPPAPDPTAMSKADALVREASGRSIDIADLYVKRKMLHRIVSGTKMDMPTKHHYDEALQALDANMDQAQKRYIQVLKDLTSVDRLSVSRSFNAWGVKLDQSDLQQQKSATRIAQKHYSELLRGYPVQIDVWSQQLSEAIPKPQGNEGHVGPI